jgi:hypothetical protein
MTTLIIPCAGKSSRFPDMKPKWLLTHPKGNLMIFAGLEKFPVETFERIVVTIHQSHIIEYEADVLLKQAAKFPIEICILEEWTSGPAETIVKTLNLMQISGPIVVKDSDNLVNFHSQDSEAQNNNFIVGVNIEHQNVSKPESKSFIVVNDQDLVVDVVEKKIISSQICAGVYGISSPVDFISSYNQCLEIMEGAEIYISHVIGHLLKYSSVPFKFLPANDFEDWGTIDEWRKVQKTLASYFFDFDGVLVENSGLYGSRNWHSEFQPIEENVEKVRELSSRGAYIIITTSRDESFKNRIIDFLRESGISVHDVVTNLSHAPRFLVNDFAPTNPYPSAIATNIPRNAKLSDYLS